MIGDTLFNIAHAAVAEFDRVFVYGFMELIVGWQASKLSNVNNIYQCWWQLYCHHNHHPNRYHEQQPTAIFITNIPPPLPALFPLPPAHDAMPAG